MDVPFREVEDADTYLQIIERTIESNRNKPDHIVSFASNAHAFDKAYLTTCHDIASTMTSLATQITRLQSEVEGLQNEVDVCNEVILEMQTEEELFNDALIECESEYGHTIALNAQLKSELVFHEMIAEENLSEMEHELMQKIASTRKSYEAKMANMKHDYEVLLTSKEEMIGRSQEELTQSREELTQSRNELTRAHEEIARSRNELTHAHQMHEAQSKQKNQMLEEQESSLISTNRELTHERQSIRRHQVDQQVLHDELQSIDQTTFQIEKQQHLKFQEELRTIMDRSRREIEIEKQQLCTILTAEELERRLQNNMSNGG